MGLSNLCDFAIKASITLLILLIFALLVATGLFGTYFKHPKQFPVSLYFDSEFSKFALLYSYKLGKLEYLKEISGTEKLPQTSDFAESTSTLNDVTIIKNIKLSYQEKFFDQVLHERKFSASKDGTTMQTLSNEEVVTTMRAYLPGNTTGSMDKPGIIVHFIGGGWLTGNTDQEENFLVSLSKQTNNVVVTVNHRKTPEFPFPAALNDCLQSLLWAYKTGSNRFNANKQKLYVSGHSVGANMAAAVSLFLNQTTVVQNYTDPADGSMPYQDIQVQQMVLITPPLFLTQLNGAQYESYIELGKSSFAIDFNTMIIYYELYLGKYQTEQMKVTAQEQKKLLDAISLLESNSYISPLPLKPWTIPKNESDPFFSRYPSTLVVTAQFDMLRDEGLTFYESLKNTTFITNKYHVHKEIPNAVHSYITRYNMDSTEVQTTLQTIKAFLH